MIESIPRNDPGRLGARIDDIIEEFGARRVLVAALRAYLRRRRRRPLPADDLSDFLRRDVGLPPAVQAYYFDRFGG